MPFDNLKRIIKLQFDKDWSFSFFIPFFILFDKQKLLAKRGPRLYIKGVVKADIWLARI